MRNISEVLQTFQDCLERTDIRLIYEGRPSLVIPVNYKRAAEKVADWIGERVSLPDQMPMATVIPHPPALVLNAFALQDDDTLEAVMKQCFRLAGQERIMEEQEDSIASKLGDQFFESRGLENGQ